MKKKTIRDIDVAGKRVFVRVDFNVPIDVATGSILDDSRIKAVLPTVAYLREQGAKVIIGSHLGRPKGKRDPKLSLAPIAARLGELIEHEVKTTDCCIGAKAQEAAHSLEPGASVLDIKPTLLRHFGLPSDGLDGRPLLEE